MQKTSFYKVISSLIETRSFCMQCSIYTANNSQ